MAATDADAKSGQPHGRPDDRSSLFAIPNLSDIDLKTLGRTIWRWRAMVLWTTVALTAASALITSRLTPLYTASGQVLVGINQVKINKIEDLTTGVDTQTERVATEIGVIRARSMAEKVIDRLGLENDPEFNPRLRPPSAFQSFLAWQTAIPRAWLAWLEPKPAGPSNTAAVMPAIVNNFLDHLKVTNDGESRIIDISFESQNPKTAAAVVNALSDAYIVARLDQKFESAKRANLWLADRLASLRKEVLTSEDAVEKFRAQNGLLRAKDSTLLAQEISQVATEAIDARTKRLDAQSRLARIQMSGGRQIATPNENIIEVLQSPLIQQLRSQEAQASQRLADLSATYGPRHPQVIQARAELASIETKIKTEIGKIIDALKNQVSTEQARENGLNAMLDNLKKQEATSGIADVKLRDLQRQADADRTLYENFLNQYKLTSSQDTFQQPDASVISHASVPQRPSFPEKGALILMSALASFTLGVFLALLCQYLDVGVRSMEQVKSVLRVYPLGMVPAPNGLATSKLAREVIDRPMSAYSEAVRTIHTNLMLSDVDKRPRVVLVTSSLPGEGKSTLALSLAQIAARYGQKVVLVDGDMRRPRLHRMATVAAKPGLIDWLVDRANFDEILQRHAIGGIDIIAAGELPTIPPNLLSSERFKQLLRGLGERYDLVVVDSAPVLALPDTRVLALLADHTLFVVRWASTSYRVAMAALQQLHDSGGNVAGAVLSAVDVKAHAKDAFADSVLYAGKLREYYR